MTRLTDDEIRKRQELTLKLRERTLNKEEGQQLREILEKEKIIAQETNDVIALGAIIFLLGGLIYFLLDNDKEKKKPRKTKRFIFF